MSAGLACDENEEELAIMEELKRHKERAQVRSLEGLHHITGRDKVTAFELEEDDNMNAFNQRLSTSNLPLKMYAMIDQVHNASKEFRKSKMYD